MVKFEIENMSAQVSMWVQWVKLHIWKRGG